MDLALNNVQRLIRNKTQTNKQTSNVMLLGWLEKMEVGGCTAAVLLDIASRICLKLWVSAN